MPQIRNLVAGAVATSSILVATACGSASGSGKHSADQPTLDPASSSRSASPTKAQASQPSTFPVPPGASGWPVKDIAGCSELGEINARLIVVRVPVATEECVKYSLQNDFLVVVASRIGFPYNDSKKIAIPGFEGTVWAPFSELNRGVLRIVAPAGDDAKYMVVWDGDTGGSTPDSLIADLFAQR